MPDKDNIQARKLNLLWQAHKQVMQTPNPALIKELQAVAFEVLLTRPGSSFTDWLTTLLNEYAEPYDAYGEDPAEDLYTLWRTQYKDPASGIEHTYEHWAIEFCNVMKVAKYYGMIKQKQKQTAY